jgi:hypothetical protein
MIEFLYNKTILIFFVKSEKEVEKSLPESKNYLIIAL